MFVCVCVRVCMGVGVGGWRRSKSPASDQRTKRETEFQRLEIKC